MEGNLSSLQLSLIVMHKQEHCWIRTCLCKLLNYFSPLGKALLAILLVYVACWHRKCHFSYTGPKTMLMDINKVLISVDFGLGPVFPKTVFFPASFDKHLYERKRNFAILLLLLKEVLHTSSCFPQFLLLNSILFSSYSLEFSACE